MKPIIASFGGGVNSTAMLLGMYECGESVDHILFADTGGEKPETYQHVEEFSAWLVAHGFPAIRTVREERFTLEQECLTAKTLPSIVTGLTRSCSDKFKIRPQERYLKSVGITEHLKLIGFDAGEGHRVTERTNLRYPLIEWEWWREECIAAIERHGLKVPPKSSCFFCPEMREWEILQLQRDHPELLERALEMERNNEKLVQIKGLARDYTWQQVIDYHRDQQLIPLIPARADKLPCICYDGE